MVLFFPHFYRFSRSVFFSIAHFARLCLANETAPPSLRSIAAFRNSASVMPAFFAASRKEIMPSLTSSVNVSHRPLFFPCSRPCSMPYSMPCSMPCSMPSRLVTPSAVSRSHFMLVMSYTSACRHRTYFIVSATKGQRKQKRPRLECSRIRRGLFLSAARVPLAGSIMGNRE